MADDKPEVPQAVREWLAMSDEDRLKANTYYKGVHDGAYEYFNRPIPTAWEDLTHEERNKVREECIRYQKEVDELGESLRSK
jgi:hypothetical protein